MLLVSAPELPN